MTLVKRFEIGIMVLALLTQPWLSSSNRSSKHRRRHQKSLQSHDHALNIDQLISKYSIHNECLGECALFLLLSIVTAYFLGFTSLPERVLTFSFLLLFSTVSLLCSSSLAFGRSC